MPSDTAPFYAGSTISDPRYFVGYREQLDTITVRAVSAQPTSINVVGEKRIGKSSLLYHFCQTYEERIESRGENPRNYLAVYLSLQQGNCQYESGFYRVVAEELGKKLEQRYDWFRQPRGLIQALNANNFDTASFYDAIVQFRDLGILPIICLDKIEALFNHPDEFNDDFYDNLRSLMDCNALMLVIASYQKLDVYSRRKNLTSSFFNLGQVMILQGFTNNEARDLVRLPETNIIHSQAVLSEKEQEIALKLGNENPYLLQLASLCLWDAKQLGRDLAWAKREFNKRKAPTNDSKRNLNRIKQFLWQMLQLFLHIPVVITRLSLKIGNIVNLIITFCVGAILILWCVLAINGQLPWITIPEQTQQFICSTLSSALGKFCENEPIQ